MLKNECKLQISLAKLGNVDEILLFFCSGIPDFSVTVSIYRMSDVEIKRIAKLNEQQFVYIDYSLQAPFGSQGLYNEYVYCNGRVYALSDVEDEV